jgi:predicted dehydrogenase
MKNKKIKFAVVGVGHIGKRHIEMIQRNKDSELVGVCDIRNNEECQFNDTSVPYFSNIEELLNSNLEIDVVNICTPNGFHADQAIQVLNSNRNVVIEKPMGLTKESCEKVLDAALKANKQVFCVMQNRYSPPSEWIKSVVDNNVLGEIFLVQVNCYWNRDERYYKKGGWKGTTDLDGGTLFTQFSHFIDIMYWLFGDIKNVEGKFKDFSHKDLTDFEDSGLINFEFVKGGIGSINYSTSIVEQNLESSITIIGSRGSVKLGGQYMNEVEICNIPDYKMPELEESNPANDYGHYKGSASNHNYVIDNVVETLKGKTSPSTNALDGLKVVEIIEKIYKLRDQKF